MEELNIENRMYKMAMEIISNRYPIGWGGVAVIHTAKDHFYTSVALDTANGGGNGNPHLRFTGGVDTL